MYLQGVHVQNHAGMEHAGLTTHVSVNQAGTENYVIKVSGWKLIIRVNLSLYLKYKSSRVKAASFVTLASRQR
jgi:hypothetical protein